MLTGTGIWETWRILVYEETQLKGSKLRENMSN
jgi:hypothetical protein